jgi:hypothetical protein
MVGWLVVRIGNIFVSKYPFGTMSQLLALSISHMMAKAKCLKLVSHRQFYLRRLDGKKGDGQDGTGDE